MTNSKKVDASTNAVNSVVETVTTKTPSATYTPEVTAQLLKAYETNKDVEKLAVQFGKKPASIRAKLSHEGVYIKQEKTTKTGAPIESKEAQIAQLAELLNAKPDSLECLNKATKAVLSQIINSLQVQSDIIGLTE